MATYRILSLDGGGIRGLLTLVMLQRLADHCPGWLEHANLIAGTSTGGIIALGLAAGLTPDELISLYTDHCQDIFDDSWLDDILDLGKITGADYDNLKLRRRLRKTLGDKLLKDLKKKVLISTFDLDNENPNPLKRSWKPKFFHNFAGNDSDGETKAYKVALYTSAAPTYFPAVDGYIDGGVIANNPSMAALAQTQDKRARITHRPSVEEVVLLSLGTGTPLTYIKGKRLDWGYAQWAKPIINVMLDGGMGLADYQCNQLLGDHYHRLSPGLREMIDLDACAKVNQLIQIGETVELDETVAWIKKHWL